MDTIAQILWTGLYFLCFLLAFIVIMVALVSVVWLIGDFLGVVLNAELQG